MKIQYKDHWKILALVLILLIACFCEESEQQIKERIEGLENAHRESIGIWNDKGTETVVFELNYLIDFTLLGTNEEELKGVIHVYWKQNNVYISSEYRPTETIRLLIYENNERVLDDQTFHMTSGFKFFAKKNIQYTLRLIPSGDLPKLIVLQNTKLNNFGEVIETKVQKHEFQAQKQKMQSVAAQIKAMSSISEFSILMSQKNSDYFLSTFEKYLVYIWIEAIIIFVIVVVQLKFMKNLLKNDNIL